MSCFSVQPGFDRFYLLAHEKLMKLRDSWLVNERLQKRRIEKKTKNGLTFKKL